MLASEKWRKKYWFLVNYLSESEAKDVLRGDPFARYYLMMVHGVDMETISFNISLSAKDLMYRTLIGEIKAVAIPYQSFMDAIRQVSSNIGRSVTVISKPLQILRILGRPKVYPKFQLNAQSSSKPYIIHEYLNQNSTVLVNGVWLKITDPRLTSYPVKCSMKDIVKFEVPYVDYDYVRRPTTQSFSFYREICLHPSLERAYYSVDLNKLRQIGKSDLGIRTFRQAQYIKDVRYQSHRSYLVTRYQKVFRIPTVKQLLQIYRLMDDAS